ncbi:unnamed protein product [Rhizophagus irregularis]|nr:unnamed protein product [Rhizophagus irregularis]
MQNPFKIHGAGGTVLSWNKKKTPFSWIHQLMLITHNGVMMIQIMRIIHHTSVCRPQDCLSAPLKEGDPVCVIDNNSQARR